MELKDKNSLVLGAGRSGIESAKFLAARGAVVALHDRKEVESWPEAARSLRESHSVALMTGEVPASLLDQIDLVVISPGVPTSTIPARLTERTETEVIGEVELAYRFMRGRIVGITGSNGKTTTTTLVGELLRNSGIRTQVGGNIGTPLLSLAETSDDETWTVAELSSFQLETIRDFRPDVAICLNVTPNHLDRYDSFLDYAAAKHRIFMNQSADNVAILNADDEITAGSDILGALLMGHDYNSWWIGSDLSIEESRRLVPHQNATTMQVAISVVAASMWMMENPTEGVRVPDELPHDYILGIARPYLGKMISKAHDWTPLTGRGNAFQGYNRQDLDRKDPWQFKNFLISEHEA